MVRGGGKNDLFDAASTGDVEKVNTLLEAGAKPDELQKHPPWLNATPLWVAALKGHLKVVEALVAKGADPNLAWEKNGTTPLWIASVFPPPPYFPTGAPTKQTQCG